MELLISEKYVNEFLIAKKMDLTINQTRNILYKISDYGLVSSTRKKDKKKGWYTYSWKIEILKSLLFLRNDLIKKISQINNQINSRETKQFYVCERCNIEISEENAMLCDFTCKECGDIFIIKNNEKFLKDIRRNLSRLNRELGFVDEEIEKQRIKMDKKKMRELKKQEKIKSAARKKAAAIRKAAKSKSKTSFPLVRQKPNESKISMLPSQSSVKTKSSKKTKSVAKVKKPVKKKLIKKKVVKKKVSKKSVAKKIIKKKFVSRNKISTSSAKSAERGVASLSVVRRSVVERKKKGKK